MKKQLSILISTIILISLISFSGCKKEGCTDATATNFDTKANKDDGTCTYVVDPYIGSFVMNEENSETFGTTLVVTNYTYTLVITKINNTTIKISNLKNTGEYVTGDVSSSGFLISSQTFDSGTIHGSGTLTGSAITMELDYTGPFSTAHSSATGTKQ